MSLENDLIAVNNALRGHPVYDAYQNIVERLRQCETELNDLETMLVKKDMETISHALGTLEALATIFDNQPARNAAKGLKHILSRLTRWR